MRGIQRSFRSGRRRAFSLLEMLVAMTVLILLLVIIFQLTDQVRKVWKGTAAKVEAYAGARAGFETITRKLSQATLNTYFDYYDSAGRSALDTNYSGEPARYGRKSELHFISGNNLVPNQVTGGIFFQAPLGFTFSGSYSGLDNLLSAAGFWVDFRADERPPFFAASGLSSGSSRFRLMEYKEETQFMTVYKPGITDSKWISPPGGTTDPSRPIADNVLALLIIPRKASETPEATTLAPDYTYDSRTAWTSGKQPTNMHQLPPVVHVVMVAAEESDMGRALGTASTKSSAASALGIDYSTLFQRAANLEADLKTLGDALTKHGINYRIFRTDVAMRGANWSE